MAPFKNQQIFDVKNEPADQAENRVVKLDNPSTPQVETFKPGSLREKGQGTYVAAKAKFGAIAATDPDRVSKSQKDSRFRVSPILRDPLTIEEEERRVIEEKVRNRITAISEDARKQGFEAGFAEGQKQGKDAAFNEVKKEAKAELARFEAFLDGCEGSKREIFKANERFLIELVFQVSKMVLLKELKTDRDYVSRLASDLIERVGAKENIRIRVNPEDLAVSAKLRGDLEAKIGTLKNLSIESSPEVQAGGCELETEWNAIDATVETQLKNIHQSLTGPS